MKKEYKNYLDIHSHYVGNDRRYELMSEILKNGTFLPKTVEYKDIDDDFKRWVERDLTITSDDGKEFPTMVLFSNQRFSEYTQSWRFTDKDKNILLNFKSISRDNNPEFGKIQNGLWNIPGENRFYTMKKQIVLDDNGSESFLVLKMHQPTAIDLVYKISVFTNKYDKINEFNALINRKFRARQCYIRPNGHFMPMTLESISDESSYQIDDRQYYAQTFNIKVMAYIITEDDYRVEEIPLKRGVNILSMPGKINIPEAEIEDCENGKNIKITVFFPLKCTKNVIHFKNDTDFEMTGVDLDNILKNYKIYVNGDKIDGNVTLHDGDEIKVMCNKMLKNQDATLVINGTKV